MRTKTFLAIAALAAAVAAPPSVAQTTTYSDAGSFSSAVGATTTVTFEGCAGTGTNAADFCSGIPSNVSFTALDFYTASPGQSTNPTTALGIDLPSGGINTITFADGTYVFGLDLFQNYGGGEQSGIPQDFLIAIYGLSGLIDTFNPTIASDGGGFFGVTSIDQILSAQVSLPGGFAVVDNVQFASITAAVPEPSTWMMMLLGFGAVGASLRRRRKGLLAKVSV